MSDEETEYTYNVTVKVSTTADSTNTALEGLADGNKTWPNMVDWSVDNEANVVNVLFKFGAKHPTKATAGTEDVKLDPTDFAAKDPTATVTVVKDDEITVTAQNNSSETYKLVSPTSLPSRASPFRSRWVRPSSNTAAATRTSSILMCPMLTTTPMWSPRLNW